MWYEVSWPSAILVYKHITILKYAPFHLLEVFHRNEFCFREVISARPDYMLCTNAWDAGLNLAHPPAWSTSRLKD